MPHDDRHADGDTVHLLYENPDWLPPVIAGLEAEGFRAVPYAVGDGTLDPAQPPPDGLWWNRMSPSAHTRGHGNAVATMRETLAWLDAWGRRVINGTRSFGFEVSKLQQDLVLRRHGVHTPRTVLAVGREAVARAGRTFETPFLVKHNQGGKGLGIALFNNADELDAHLDAGGFDPDPNGQVVVQQYIRPAEPFITRVELVGGKFLFAMRSSTVGGFELCPSDFCQAEGLDLAGIEFLEDADGHRFTYDINANTNYNAALGRSLGLDGMREVARWIRRELAPRRARG